MTVQEMREQLARVVGEMRSILDAADKRADGNGLSAEERQTYERLEADADRLEENIALRERQSARDERLAQPADPGIVLPGGAGDQRTPDEARGEYRRVFYDWARRGANLLPSADQEVLHRGFQDFANANDPEMRALAAGTSAAGGYTVPPEFENRLVERLVTISSVLPYVNVIDTENGSAINWPTTDLTGQEGELIGENTQVTELDPVFGTATLGAYLYSSKMVRVPYNLLQDSFVNLEQWLPDKLGDRLGRIHNRHFTVGTGTGQPQGITAAAVGVTAPAGNTTSVPYDSLIDLEFSIDDLYLPNARFMLSRGALQAIRKVKDTTGQYIWQPSVRDGVPSTLLGYPYSTNSHMAAPAASAKTILFGDFRAGYVVRRVRGFTLLRLSERYAEFLQVAFLGFDRYDGKLDDLNAIRAFQHSAT